MQAALTAAAALVAVALGDVAVDLAQAVVAHMAVTLALAVAEVAEVSAAVGDEQFSESIRRPCVPH